MIKILRGIRIKFYSEKKKTSERPKNKNVAKLHFQLQYVQLALETYPEPWQASEYASDLRTNIYRNSTIFTVGLLN